MFRSTVQPGPFGKGQAGEWRRVPKWLIKSHSDATRASWKIPLMSAVSNVSHRKSHQGQQPSRANYWGQEQLRMVVMGFLPRAPRLRTEHSNLLCGWTGRWAVKWGGGLGMSRYLEQGLECLPPYIPARTMKPEVVHPSRRAKASSTGIRKSTYYLSWSFLKEIKEPQ